MIQLQKEEVLLLVTKKPIHYCNENNNIALRSQWSDFRDRHLLFYECRYTGNKPSSVQVAGRTFHRCCEVYYLDTSEVDLVGPFFNYLSANYENTVQKWKNAGAYKWVFTEFLGTCKKKNGWILDLGAGHGFGTEIYKKIPHGKLRLVSFDLSNAMLVRCPKGVDRIVGKAGHLPFSDQCLCGIVAVYMLHYLAIPENAFEEIARTLEPRGIFGFVAYRHDSQKNKYHEILKNNGFEIAGFKTDDGNPPEYRIIAIKSE